MLAKIENIYLSILRVVILVSATLALLVAAFALVSSVPSMLRWVGISQPEKALGGNLREFIAEQKITETKASSSVEGGDQLAVLPKIAHSAEIIHKYLGDRAQLSERDWRTGLQNVANDFVLDGDAYADSVFRVAKELEASTGAPLSEERVLQLFDWNTERFRDDLEQKRLSEAQEASNFWVKLAVAGTGFLTFVAIIFIFLFVKIERNLRPARGFMGEPGFVDEGGVDN